MTTLLTTLLKAWVEEFIIVIVLHLLQTDYLPMYNYNYCNCSSHSTQYKVAQNKEEHAFLCCLHHTYANSQCNLCTVFTTNQKCSMWL